MATAKKQQAAPPPAERGRSEKQAVKYPSKDFRVKRNGELTRAAKKVINKTNHRELGKEILKSVTAANANLVKTPSGKVLVVQGDKPRPTVYTPELGARICAMFASDSRMTLSRLNSDPEMPTLITFYQWLDEQPTLSKAYSRAREIQFDLQAEELNSIARDPLTGVTTVERTGSDGKDFTETRTSDNVQRAALMVSTTQWILARMRPKKYGVAPVEADGNDALRDLLGEFRARSKQLEAENS